MAILILIFVLSFLYLIAKLLSKASSGGNECSSRTLQIWLSVSSIVALSYWLLVTANARWAENKCEKYSVYHITKTVNAEGFYAHSTSVGDFLPYIINGYYSYVELLNFKGRSRVKRVYLANIDNPYCQDDFFKNRSIKGLPVPPIPENMCVAIEYTDKVKSRYKFEQGNLRWVSGKGTAVHKVIDTTNNKVISTWTGFVGRSYFKTFGCRTPKNGTLYERTIKLNKPNKRDAVTGDIAPL